MSANPPERKTEADRLPRLTIEDLQARKMLTLQKGGWVSWHDPYTSDQVSFFISRIVMYEEVPETEDYGAEEDDGDYCGTNGYIDIGASNVTVGISKAKEGERKPECRISITTTPGTVGGLRYWFECTQMSCNRRVGVLYLKNGYLACLNCHNLTYKSRNLSGKNKKMGVIIPPRKLQEMEDAIKRTTYMNRPTKRMERFKKKLERSRSARDHRLNRLEEKLDKLEEDKKDSPKASKG